MQDDELAPIQYPNILACLMDGSATITKKELVLWGIDQRQKGWDAAKAQTE